MSAEFCCGIKSSDFNCSCATSGFLMLNNRSKNGGWHLFQCLDCFILLLPMFLVFSLLLFYLKPNLEFFGLRTLNPGWQRLGFAFSEAMNLNESLYLFRDAKCPLWDEAPLPALGWPVSDPLKREGSPVFCIVAVSRNYSVRDFPVCWALFWPWILTIATQIPVLMHVVCSCAWLRPFTRVAVPGSWCVWDGWVLEA